MKKAPTITLSEADIVSPEGSGLSLVSEKCTGALLDPGDEEILNRIAGELEAYNRHLEAASFIALRTGLFLIKLRDSGKHGDLEPIISSRFADRSRRTLFNYIKIAETFLLETRLRNETNHKLNNEAVTATLEAQLDLFSTADLGTSPKLIAKAVQRVRDWVAGRGIKAMLRDFAEGEEDRVKPPDRSGKDSAPKKSKRALQKAAMQSASKEFATVLQAGHWKLLDHTEIETLITWLRETAEIIESDFAKHKR